MTAKAQKKSAAKVKQPKGKKVEIEMELPLSDKEKVKRGEQAFALMEQQTTLEAEFTKVKKAWKEDINSCATKARKLLEEFGTGRELKKIEVTEVVNFDRKMVEYWRGGKIVQEKKMDDVVKESRPKPTPPKGDAGDDDGKQPALPLGDEGLKASVAELAGKACATPAGKKTRGQKQPLTDAEEERDQEILESIREDTNRKTKTSSVDGARA